MTHTQTTYMNHIALREDKKGARPAEVGALPQCSKNQLQSLNNKNY